MRSIANELISYDEGPAVVYDEEYPIVQEVPRVVEAVKEPTEAQPAIIELKPVDMAGDINQTGGIVERYNLTAGHSEIIANALKDYFRDITDIDEIDESILDNLVDTLVEFGLARDFVQDVWQKKYYGNAGLGKALTLSFGCARCSNTKGLYVVVIGTPGYGKSAGVKTMLNLINPHYVDEGSDSDKAIYYNDLKPGVCKFRDDEVLTNESGRIMKESYTYFQTGIERNVSIKQCGTEEYVTEKKIGAQRLTFWATCADFNADEQIRNRFLQIEVKGDKEQLKAIHRHINQQASGNYQTPQVDTLETRICRKITGILGPLLFEVVIPFSERIEFFNTDPRTQNMFLDAIRASAIWNYRCRRKDKFGRLQAAIEDYDQALDMFKSIGGQSINKFTEAEKAVLSAIIAKGHEATSTDIQKIVGVNRQRLNQIMYGRDQKNEQQKYGLTAKCPELIIHSESKPYSYELPKEFTVDTDVHVKLMDENLATGAAKVTDTDASIPKENPVFCYNCGYKFSVGDIDDIRKVACPKCGETERVYYSPVSPITIPLPPEADLSIITGRLALAREKFKDGKKLKGPDEKLAEACQYAIDILNECKMTGIVPVDRWCPSCEGRVWDKQKRRYFWAEDIIPGASCELKNHVKHGNQEQ